MIINELNIKCVKCEYIHGEKQKDNKLDLKIANFSLNVLHLIYMM